MWHIEIKDTNNKTLEIKFSDGIFEIISVNRPLSVREINDLWVMVNMMLQTNYKHMECTKQ